MWKHEQSRLSQRPVFSLPSSRRLKSQFSGTLISDGYAAYARYAAAQDNITHAQCWVHSRRYFIEAQKEHPEKATEALQQIAKLYQNEETIKKLGLSGQKKHHVP